MTRRLSRVLATLAVVLASACGQPRLRASPIIDGYRQADCVVPTGPRKGYTGTQRWERTVSIPGRASVNILAWHGPEEQLNVFHGPASPASAASQLYVHVLDLRVDERQSSSTSEHEQALVPMCVIHTSVSSTCVDRMRAAECWWTRRYCRRSV